MESRYPLGDRMFILKKHINLLLERFNFVYSVNSQFAMKRPISLLALIACCCLSVYGQDPNGPGGVFSTTGASNLRGWFDANDLDGDDDFTDNPANNTAVTTWVDKSSSGNNLTQATVATRPAYNTGGTYKAVNFRSSTTAGQTDFMSFVTPAHYVPGTAYFVLLATDPGGTNLVSHILLEDANRSLRLEQYDNTDHIGYTVYGDDDYETNIAPNYGAYSILSFRKSAADDNVLVNQNAGTATLDINSDTDGIPIGTMGKASNVEGANYNCVEIITYNVLLNTAQARIVDNYLSSKYGNIAIANDIYAMDAAGSGNHDYDVAGIGRVNATNTHTAAQSSIVNIGNPTSLANNDFLLWGHNNGVLEPQTTDLPTGIQARFTRTWGVTETGEVGNINVRFDMTGLGNVTPSDLRLLIDTDNDGIFGEANTTQVTGAAQVTGALYQFAGINLTTSTRFTLGTINRTQTPLPVELVSFTGKLEDGVVNFNWKTASELNNDYFTLERSTDGKSFGKIAVIKGAGTSVNAKEYNATDDAPPAGRIYYRLKQTDFDGTTDDSKAILITNENPASIAVYPNPVKPGGLLTVKLSNYTADVSIENGMYTLVDTGGREFELIVTERNADRVTLKIPDEAKTGMYFLRIGTATQNNFTLNKVMIAP